MLNGGLVLGPVKGTYHSLFQKEISNIPTFTPILFNQTRRITRHNVSVARYKSVMKNGHDWSPASTLWRVDVTSLTTSMSTMRFLLEILSILKAIKSDLKGSYDKQNLTLEVILYEIY